MTNGPLIDGTYENLVADFLRWQRRAKTAAAIAVIAGLLLIGLGTFAFLRAEDTRTIIQSPTGVPCANPTSARCITESVGVSRAIGFVEACRIVEAARLEAPSCAVARTGAGPLNPPERNEGGDATGPPSGGGGQPGGGQPPSAPGPQSVTDAVDETVNEVGQAVDGATDTACDLVQNPDPLC